MSKFQNLIEAYGVSHKNKTNKLIHWVCVPAIFFSIVGLLSVIPFPWESEIIKNIELNWSFFALVLVLIYYVSLSIPISIGMALFSLICIYFCSHLNTFDYPLWTYLGIFAVSWVFQFIGHQIEGKKPSFLQDIQFLLIGPAWLMHFIYKKLNIRY
ncbi:DUF962 domain-containing protein [Crocinitomicaceae bacterium]|nr:DUF962 domain-containing protein [Crocinitomicaceae bacterium]